MASLNEIKLDVDDLNNLLKVTTRPRVKEFLSKEINRLSSILESSKSENKATNGETPKLKTNATPGKYYTDITNYAWDQSEKFIKVYITIRGGNLDNDSVSCEFKKQSYMLKIENVDGKNYKQQISHLQCPINEEESYFKVKSDTVVLWLRKQDQHSWTNVTRTVKKDTFKPPKMDDTKDPNESIMKLMQQMYEDGDDEMKRTIAKSFAESRKMNGAGDF